MAFGNVPGDPGPSRSSDPWALFDAAHPEQPTPAERGYEDAGPPSAPTTDPGPPTLPNSSFKDHRRQLAIAVVVAGVLVLIAAGASYIGNRIGASPKPSPLPVPTVSPSTSSCSDLGTCPSPTPANTETAAPPADAPVRNQGIAVLFQSNDIDLDSRLSNWSEGTSSSGDLAFYSSGLSTIGNAHMTSLASGLPATITSCAAATGIISSVD